VKERLDRWMFESFSLDPRSLGVARIFIGLYLVLYRTGDLRWIDTLPSSFFRPPPGPLRLLGGIPSSGALTAVSVGLSVASVALLVGYHTRLASCATGALLFLVDGLGYSFGHVHHSDTFLTAVVVIMAGSNWGAAYSIDALRRRDRAAAPVQAWPIALAAVLLGFLMLTAGLPKLATGWLDPSVLAVRDHIVHLHFASPTAGHLATLALDSENPWLWKPFDYLTLWLELGFIFAITSPRATRSFCAAAVLFHLGILLTFDIDFTGNVVAYAIFFEWSYVVDRARPLQRFPWATAFARRARLTLARSRAPIGAAVFAAGVALYLVTRRVGKPAEYVAGWITTRPGRVAPLVLFVFVLPIAVAYLVAALSSRFHLPGAKLRKA